MEQFEAIRRDHAREGLSIRELARRHGGASAGGWLCAAIACRDALLFAGLSDAPAD